MEEKGKTELEQELARLRARIAELEGETFDANLRSIAQQIPDNIMLLDRDERIQFINWTVPDLTVVQVLGTQPYEYLLEPHREATRGCYRRVLATGEPARIETDYVADDGMISKWETRATPLMRSNRVDGVIVISTNITDRDEAAADRDRLFRLSVDMLCIATLGGYFKRVSPAFRETLGWSDAQLLSRPFIEFVHQVDREGTLAELERIRKSPAIIDFENRFECSDLSFRCMQWRAIAQPELGLIYMVARDVTSQVTLQAQLRQSQKMEAVGQLAGGIAHDFNNLLMTIGGNTDLALRQANPTECLNEIKLAAARGAALTQQLLAFSHKQPKNVTQVDLAALAGNMMAMLRRTIPENIEIDLLAAKNLPQVAADAGQIEQVLLNLCINARDAILGRGHIAIQLGLASFDENTPPKRHDVKPGRYVWLSVTDDGSGIPPEIRERIFEPFFTTKEPGRGTGLGLSTVFGIVTSHGGSIHVETEVGVQTTFTIYLPACETAARPVRPVPEQSVMGGTETILVAEDDDRVRAVVVRLLEEVGYRVVTASDGEEAVRQVKERGGALDLVLIDMVMPNMTGDEAYSQIKAIRPELRVLFTTGFSASALNGAYGEQVLYKPYERHELLQSVRRRLDE